MTSPPQSRTAALMKHLEGLAEREDRGGLAALRRGLGKEPGTVPEMYRYVEPFLAGTDRAQTDAAYMVASLFGLHPVPWAKPADAPWNTGFGWSLRSVRSRDDGAENEGVTRRFTATLNCERDALPTHLRQLLTLLHSKHEGAPIDWERLFWDILNWEDVDRRVQRRWAEGFWRGGVREGATADAAEPDADDESSDEEQDDEDQD